MLNFNFLHRKDTMKTIFITGAGAGIGLATARRFAKEGWFVGGADCAQEALDALEEEIGTDHCSTHAMDVVDPASIQRALKEFANRTGGQLDVLHNNAGILRVGAFEEISLEDHQRIIEINVIGLLNVLHTAFPYLRDTRKSQVVNMSSASAIFGIPDFASYSGSKHAVRAMTEALSIEWERHDIRVCDLMPPFVNTGMVQSNNNSRLITRLGANLSAEDVAEEVWNLTRKPQLHRPISWSLRATSAIASATPPQLVRDIVKRLWKE